MKCPSWLGRWVSGQKHLLFKHGNLSLDPQQRGKSKVWPHFPARPVLQEGLTGGSLGLADWPACQNIGELQNLSQEKKVEGERAGHPIPFCGLHMHRHTPSYSIHTDRERKETDSHRGTETERHRYF